MTEPPHQQQMKTSFLFIQLQAFPARALPTQSPAAAASTAAPGGLEAGHSFPSPRTGFLAGRDLGRTQGLAAPPSSLLQKGGPGTEGPAAFTCSAPGEKKAGDGKPRERAGGRSGGCRCPHRGHRLAPASGKLGRLLLPPCQLPSPAPVMSDGSSSRSMGWEHWPGASAPQDLGDSQPRCSDALGCSMAQASPAHAADQQERALLSRSAATHRVSLRSCEEDTGTTVRATRARLCRYCPEVQTSKGCPAPPATLPLKVRTCVCPSPPDSGCPTKEREQGTDRPSRPPVSTPATPPRATPAGDVSLEDNLAFSEAWWSTLHVEFLW
ncbi:nascent polypeptide-associated complex subunit alpha, muscle-specific form-like [Carlito syrichta]|uniref:Nascent polypeptide-associated complex subunit alpha, muscle-specific form-like n=1 Tax=Carlito syrichta TaxID=1868482 RepID=A0A3Q0DKM4_CARSF|nr:nascent polypeptide-associated complex subunit alpha, muscle-specific form-like [Carlito syrichta]